MEDFICESYECGFDEYLENCLDPEDQRNKQSLDDDSIAAVRQQISVPNFLLADGSFELENQRFLDIEKGLDLNEVEEKEEGDQCRTKKVTKNSHNFEIENGFQKNANYSTADSFSLISSTNSYASDMMTQMMSQSQHPWRHKYQEQQCQFEGRQQEAYLPFDQAEPEYYQKCYQNYFFSDAPLDRIHGEGQGLRRQGSFIQQVSKDYECEKKQIVIQLNAVNIACHTLFSSVVSSSSSSEEQGLDQLDCSVFDVCQSNAQLTGDNKQKTQFQSLDQEKKSLIDCQVSLLTEGRLIVKDIHSKSSQKIMLGEIYLNNKSNNSKNQRGFRRIHSVTETLFGVSVEYGSCDSMCEFIPQEIIQEFLMENSQNNTGEHFQEQLKIIMDYQMRMRSLREMISIESKSESISKVIKNGELLLRKIEKSSSKKEYQMYEYSIIRVRNGIPSVLSQGMSNGLISVAGLSRNTLAQQLLRTNDWLMKIDETPVQSVLRNISLNNNRWNQQGQQNNNNQKRQQKINVIDQAFQAHVSSAVYQISPQQNAANNSKSHFHKIQVTDYLCIDSYSELSAIFQEPKKEQNLDDEPSQIDQSYSMNNSQDSLEEFLKDIQSSSIPQVPRVSSGIMKKSLRQYYTASKVIVDKYYKTYSESQRLQQQIHRLLNKRNHKYK